MVADAPPNGTASAGGQAQLPPVTELAVASMVLVVAGGIYLSAYLPGTAPVAPAVALLVLAAALVTWNIVSLRRLHSFAWSAFFLVGRWTLLAYLVIAGMLEYVFVVDGTRGAVLAVLTLMLAVFAVDVPVILAFSVARYQPPAEPGRIE